jgi:hypothetical protein
MLRRVTSSSSLESASFRSSTSDEGAESTQQRYHPESEAETFGRVRTGPEPMERLRLNWLVAGELVCGSSVVSCVCDGSFSRRNHWKRSGSDVASSGFSHTNWVLEPDVATWWNGDTVGRADNSVYFKENIFIFDFYHF